MHSEPNAPTVQAPAKPSTGHQASRAIPWVAVPLPGGRHQLRVRARLSVTHPRRVLVESQVFRLSGERRGTGAFRPCSSSVAVALGDAVAWSNAIAAVARAAAQHQFEGSLPSGGGSHDRS